MFRGDHIARLHRGQSTNWSVIGFVGSALLLMGYVHFIGVYAGQSSSNVPKGGELTGDQLLAAKKEQISFQGKQFTVRVKLPT